MMEGGGALGSANKGLPVVRHPAIHQLLVQNNVQKRHEITNIRVFWTLLLEAEQALAFFADTY
jgi:hypothetical protein